MQAGWMAGQKRLSVEVDRHRWGWGGKYWFNYSERTETKPRSGYSFEAIPFFRGRSRGGTNFMQIPHIKGAAAGGAEASKHFDRYEMMIAMVTYCVVCPILGLQGLGKGACVFWVGLSIDGLQLGGEKI